MTDTTAPAASPDIAPAPSAPDAPTQAPAAEPTAPSTPAERRARAVARLEARNAPAPEPEAAPTVEAAPAPEAPAAAPSAPAESPETRIAKRLAEQRTAREERRAAQERAQAEQQQRQWQQQLASTSKESLAREVAEEFRRDPVGTREKYGIDPRADLEALTQRMLHGAGAKQGDEALSIAKRAQEEAAQLRQYMLQQQEQQAVAQRVQQFTQQTSDAAKWPLLAKLDPDDRLYEGRIAWAELAEQGSEYDPELIADMAEARLSKRHAKWAPPAPAPAPTPPAAVTPKTRARTITPALAGDTGTPPNLTREQRKARLVADIQRADAAKHAARNSS